ncbi:hypothetical protein [Streptomyces sp. NPDC020983]|uniref:hypothetical protein n=1 Tax=Streptomyces sp. NPDC020983 TaxID=3365106 RepID=UPI0037B44BBF
MARTVPVLASEAPGNYLTGALWNANLKALGDFLMNPPRCNLYSSVQQSLAHNISATLTFDTEVEDTDGGHSTLTNTDRYTCQVPGVYLLTGQVNFAALNTTGLRLAEWRVTTAGGSASVPPGGESLLPPSASQTLTIVLPPTYIRLAVGDYVQILALQTSGSPIAVGGGGGGTQTQMSCLWIAA